MLVAPVMLPGAEGAEPTATARVDAELVPQLEDAVTLTLPDVLPKFTDIEVVPCPAVMLDPEGTVQV